MAHRAYKTLHPLMMAPDGFTLEPVDVIVPTTPEEPQDYTTALVPLTVEQYNFMTATLATEQNQVQKIPGYMRQHLSTSSTFCHNGTPQLVVQLIRQQETSMYSTSAFWLSVLHAVVSYIIPIHKDVCTCLQSVLT